MEDSAVWDLRVWEHHSPGHDPLLRFCFFIAFIELGKLLAGAVAMLSNLVARIRLRNVCAKRGLDQEKHSGFALLFPLYFFFKEDSG